MKILFIQPAVGHKGGGAEYPKTWIMEPLALAVLSALTPRRIERMFMDDRLGEVDYSVEADVVAMPVECYTAARSYEIAAKFRANGAKVFLGGFLCRFHFCYYLVFRHSCGFCDSGDLAVIRASKP